jgi:hypothetical protein
MNILIGIKLKNLVIIYFYTFFYYNYIIIYE